jgi:ribose transport system substrate-binding protein
MGASLLTQQHSFYIELANAMKADVVKDHAQIDIAIANQDSSKQIADVQDFVTKRVDAVVISPVDSKGVQAALLTAQPAGIPMITVDISAQCVDVASRIGINNQADNV